MNTKDGFTPVMTINDLLQIEELAQKVEERFLFEHPAAPAAQYFKLGRVRLSRIAHNASSGRESAFCNRLRHSQRVLRRQLGW